MSSIMALGVHTGCWATVFVAEICILCYLKYIYGALIFKSVSGRTYYIEKFDFPKERGLSLGVCLHMS